MRIGIDLRPLQTASGRRGVGTYARHLVRALRACRQADEEMVGFVSTGRSLEGIEADQLDSVVKVPGPSRGITVLDPIRLPRLLRRERIDLYHSLFYAAPVRRPPGVKVVQTVHDLTPVLFPEAFTRRQRLIFRAAFACAARADRVVSVSENTRRDLARLAAIPPAHVEVIPPGIDPAFRDAPVCTEPDPALLERHGVDGPYLLHVGGFDPVKNLSAALEALARLRGEGFPHRLVVAGDPGSHGPAFRREAERLWIEAAVTTTGWIPVSGLIRLYQGAEVMVYPSRYEGFGLPPVEAMACGTPVVASSAGSLPEVLGDSCPLVDPDDAEGFAREIGRLLRDPEARREAARRGREHAARYGWEASARKTLAMYRRLAAGERTPRAAARTEES